MPNPEQIQHTLRSSKAEELRAYVRQEIDDLRDGRIERLSTFTELNSLFGYKYYVSVRNALARSTALLQERENVKKETLPAIVPSTEWAWMIGILSGGGHVSPTGQIRFSNPSPELREAFQSRGEQLFKVNVRIEPLYGKRKSPTIVFNNLSYARALGNFTREACVNTILNHHDWLTKDDKYIWAFIEGFFDVQGIVYKLPRKKYDNIDLQTVHQNVANFLTELLARVGIEHPTIRLSPRTSDGIDRVGIASLKDVEHLSKHVHSHVPEKEERLASYRDLDIKEAQKQIKTRDAVYQWSKITAILGHSPSSQEITILKKLGLTKYSSNVYTNKFGRRDNKPSFGDAKKTLSKILESQSEGFEFDENEIKYARTIFEANKPKKGPHIPAKGHSNDDVILEWIRLITELGHTPNYHEIMELRKQGKTKYSPIVYIGRFGVTDQGANFIVARNTLMRIILEQTGIESQALPSKRGGQRKFSDEEVVLEWIKIKNTLGHSPSYDEIYKLHKQGLTRMSYPIYRNRFGKERSWTSAKENLDKLAFGKETNNLLEQYEYTSGKQIKFVPKIHRPSEKEDKRRLNQITGYTHQVSTPQVLYGHDGESIIFPSLKIEDIRSGQRYTIDPVTKLIVLKEPDKNKPTSQEIQLFP